MSATERQTWRGPKAREENITSEEVLDECVIYDLERHTAHSLNATAAEVWRRCDGRTTTDALAARMSEQYGMPVSETEPIVAMTLDDLVDAQLLEPGSYKATQSGLTRRQILSRVAVGSLGFLLPAIFSLTAPPVSVAQSKSPNLERFGFDFEVGCRDDTDCPAGSKCVSGQCT